MERDAGAERGGAESLRDALGRDPGGREARVERLRRMTANEFGTEVREIADSVFLIRSAA